MYRKTIKHREEEMEERQILLKKKGRRKAIQSPSTESFARKIGRYLMQISEAAKNHTKNFVQMILFSDTQYFVFIREKIWEFSSLLKCTLYVPQFIFSQTLQAFIETSIKSPYIHCFLKLKTGSTVLYSINKW